MTELSEREAIAAAIKTTEYKYFGDYEMSDDQHAAVDVLIECAKKYALRPSAPQEALPKRIGRLNLGDRPADGERMCNHSHYVEKGHPLYWPDMISQYDDSDPYCLEHAIELTESDNSWCERCIAADLAATKSVPQDAHSIFAAIQHGDDMHREWLREALEAVFDGKPIPKPRGKGATSSVPQDIVEALEPFAKLATVGDDGKWLDAAGFTLMHHHEYVGCLKLADLRRARTALSTLIGDQSPMTGTVG